jgi:CMP-N-acetylneuraminic acid synthetase
MDVAKAVAKRTHNNMRRQDIQGFLYDDGNIYIIDRDVNSAVCWFGDKICKYVLEKELNYEIDDDIDFFVVEKLLEKRICEKNQPF